MKKIMSMLLLVCLMAGMLIGIVSAADAKQAVVLLPGRAGDGSYTNVHVELNEGETKYLLTNDDGYVTYNGASASNYNIKWEYPTGGTPTLYLKNAYLENSQYMCIAFGRSNYGQLPNITTFDVILKVEADSTILAKTRDVENSLVGYSGIAFGNKGSSTLTGPGKLTVTSESNSAISSGGGDFLIKDINLKADSLMPESWGTRNSIFVYSGNLIIENSNLDLYTKTGPSIWSSEKQWERIGDPYDITIKNSTVKAVADIYSTENAIVGAMGKIYVDNSNVELISTGAPASKGIKCFSRKPTLTNVTAIGGKTQDKATEFNPSKNATTYYFKCTATGGRTTPAPTTPVGGGTTTTPTTPVGGGTTTTPTTPVGGGTTTTPTTPVGGGTTTTTPTTPVGGGDVVDPTTGDVVDPTTGDVVNPTTGDVADPTTGDNNNGSTNESKPATSDKDTTTDGKSEDKGGSNVVLYIVIAVVAVAAIGGGVFFFLKKKKAA